MKKKRKIAESLIPGLIEQFGENYEEHIDKYFIDEDEFTDEEIQWIYDTYIKGSDEAPTVMITSLEQYQDIIINHPDTYNMDFISDEVMKECDDWDFWYITGIKK